MDRITTQNPIFAIWFKSDFYRCMFSLDALVIQIRYQSGFSLTCSMTYSDWHYEDRDVAWWSPLWLQLKTLQFVSVSSISVHFWWSGEVPNCIWKCKCLDGEMLYSHFASAYTSVLVFHITTLHPQLTYRQPCPYYSNTCRPVQSADGGHNKSDPITCKWQCGQ